MPRYCAECGAQLPASARFCVSCGAQVVPTPTPDVVPAHSRGGEPSTPRRAGADEQATAPMPEASSSPSPPGTQPPPATQPISPVPPAGAPAAATDPFSAWPDASTHRAPTHRPPPPDLLGASGFEGDATPAAVRRPTWPVLVIVAVLLVAGLLWAISALGGGKGGSGTASGTSPAAGKTSVSSAVSSSASPTSTESAQAQAARTAVGSVLDAGRGSRTTLVQGIDAYCSKGDQSGGTAQIRDALQGRMAQLAKLNDVGEGPFTPLPGGHDARAKLKAALQAAMSADQVYVQMADAGTVCQGSAELSAANTQASTAKKTFLDTWNPLMTKAKLQGLASDDI